MDHIQYAYSQSFAQKGMCLIYIRAVFYRYSKERSIRFSWNLEREARIFHYLYYQGERCEKDKYYTINERCETSFWIMDAQN